MGSGSHTALDTALDPARPVATGQAPGGQIVYRARGVSHAATLHDDSRLTIPLTKESLAWYPWPDAAAWIPRAAYGSC